MMGDTRMMRDCGSYKQKRIKEGKMGGEGRFSARYLKFFLANLLSFRNNQILASNFETKDLIGRKE